MKKLGKDPATGLDVTLRSGRFGPYVQLGEAVRRRRSPSAPACRKGSSPDDVDLDRALGLLSLPREVGKHPETASRSSPASAASALTCSTARPTPISTAGDDVLTIGLNRAVDADRGEDAPSAPRKGRRSAPIPAARSAIIPTRAGRSW